MVLILYEWDSLFEKGDLFVFEFKLIFILPDTFEDFKIVFEIGFDIALGFWVFFSMELFFESLDLFSGNELIVLGLTLIFEWLDFGLIRFLEFFNVGMFFGSVDFVQLK